MVSQNGDKFEFKTLSTFRNYELSFTVGVEFDEYTKGLDSRNIKVGRPLIYGVLEGIRVKDSLCDESVFPIIPLDCMIMRTCYLCICRVEIGLWLLCVTSVLKTDATNSVQMIKNAQ